MKRRVVHYRLGLDRACYNSHLKLATLSLWKDICLSRIASWQDGLNSQSFFSNFLLWQLLRIRGRCSTYWQYRTEFTNPYHDFVFGCSGVDRFLDVWIEENIESNIGLRVDSCEALRVHS